MIVVMAEEKTQTLGEYIKEKLGERSLGALSRYAGISISTASNLVNGVVDSPDPKTLMKVAEYLGVPVRNLYRLAGYLPEAEDLRGLLVEEALHHLVEMDEDEQRMALDMILAIKRNSPKEG